MDVWEKLAYGFVGGVTAFVITLVIPLLSKFFGVKVKFPPAEQLAVQLVLAAVLGILFGGVGAVGAFVGGPDNASKAIFMGGGSQALFKEAFASVKAAAQQPDTEGQPEKPVPALVKAVASSGQSFLYRDWR